MHKSRDQYKTPKKKGKQSVRNHFSLTLSSDEELTDSEGTDFEAEYLMKARARRQSDPRR